MRHGSIEVQDIEENHPGPVGPQGRTGIKAFVGPRPGGTDYMAVHMARARTVVMSQGLILGQTWNVEFFAKKFGVNPRHKGAYSFVNII